MQAAPAGQREDRCEPLIGTPQRDLECDLAGVGRGAGIWRWMTDGAETGETIDLRRAKISLSD